MTDNDKLDAMMYDVELYQREQESKGANEMTTKEIKTAYRGTAYNPMSTQHYAVYLTTDIGVAEYFAGATGKVYTMDVSGLTIVDMDTFAVLLAENYPQYANINTDHNLADYPLFGDDSECYDIAQACKIDGVIDEYGNIEIYNGLDIVVID